MPSISHAAIIVLCLLNVAVINLLFIRTPVKWAKYRPEKPMGEITEEGNKDEDEKKQEDEKKEGGEKKERTEENKEVCLAVTCL